MPDPEKRERFARIQERSDEAVEELGLGPDALPNTEATAYEVVWSPRQGDERTETVFWRREGEPTNADLREQLTQGLPWAPESVIIRDVTELDEHQ